MYLKFRRVENDNDSLLRKITGFVVVRGRVGVTLHHCACMQVSFYPKEMTRPLFSSCFRPLLIRREIALQELHVSPYAFLCDDESSRMHIFHLS